MGVRDRRRQSVSSSKLAQLQGTDARRAAASEKSRKVSAKSAGAKVVLAHVREQVEQIRARDLPVRLDTPDSIHKMRVATRRLRSALTTLAPLLDAEVVRPLRGELEWLAGELGAARDAEVMRDRVRTAVHGRTTSSTSARSSAVRPRSWNRPTARLTTGC